MANRYVYYEKANNSGQCHGYTETHQQPMFAHGNFASPHTFDMSWKGRHVITDRYGQTLNPMEEQMYDDMNNTTNDHMDAVDRQRNFLGQLGTLKDTMDDVAEYSTVFEHNPNRHQFFQYHPNANPIGAPVISPHPQAMSSQSVMSPGRKTIIDNSKNPPGGILFGTGGNNSLLNNFPVGRTSSSSFDFSKSSKSRKSSSSFLGSFEESRKSSKKSRKSTKKEKKEKKSKKSKVVEEKSSWKFWSKK